MKIDKLILEAKEVEDKIRELDTQKEILNTELSEKRKKVKFSKLIESPYSDTMIYTVNLLPGHPVDFFHIRDTEENGGYGDIILSLPQKEVKELYEFLKEFFE